MDRVHRTCRLLLLALIAVIFVFGLEAANAQTPPTVWIQRGSGTGSGVEPTGAYGCTSTKLFYIWVDNTQITPPTVWTGTYYNVTFPKKYFPSSNSLIPKTSGSIATGYTVTSDGDNWKVRINLSAIGGTVKASIPFEMSGHNCGVLPQGTEFTPKVEYLNAQDQVLHTIENFTNPENVAGVQSSPFVFGNGNIYSDSYIQNTPHNYQTFYGGSAYTDNGVNYINPATARSLKFQYIPRFSQLARQFIKGKLEITLPTYPCKTGTCTAEFDAAQSPGWTQVGDKLVYTYDVSGSVTPANQYNYSTISNLIANQLGNKPYYLKFPNATLTNGGVTTGPLTTRGDALDLVPVNQGPTDPPRTTTKSQTFYLTAKVPDYLGKGPDGNTINVDPGYMHESDKNYDWYFTVGSSTSSIDQEVIEIVDEGLDPRLYIHKIKVPSLLAMNLESVTGVTAGGASEAIAFTPTTSPNAEITISNIDPAAAAGVAAQVDLVENHGVTDYSTLPVNVRKYEKFILKFKPGTALPAGQTRYIYFSSRFLNPYTLNAVVGATGTYCSYSNGTPVAGTNPNVLCNFAYATNSNGTLRDTAYYQLQGSTPYISGYSVGTTNEGGTGSIVSVGTKMRLYTSVQLCNFTRGHIHRGLTYTVLLPPGAEYYDDNPSNLSGTTGIYPTNSALRQFVLSKTVLPNFKNTGRTAVEIKFKDFKHSDVFGSAITCQYIEIYLRFRVGPDAIPDEMEAFYQQQHAAQAGEVPSDKPNEFHAFWHFDNYTEIRKGTNPSGQGAYAADANGNYVYGVYLYRYLTRDHLDLNENGTPSDPTASPDDQIIHMTQTLKVAIPANLYASKFIFKGSDQPSRNDTSVPLNGDYIYRLQVDNKTAQDYGHVLFYDVLPHVGDTMYASSGMTPTPRGSEFPGVLTGPMTGNAVGKYDVHYCTKPNPSNDPKVGIEDAANGGCDWVTGVADWSTVTAVRMRLKDGEALEKLGAHYFDMPMKAPDIVTDWETSYDISANAFAISYNDGSTFGESNLVRAIKNVAFPVKKIWVGGRNHPQITVQLYQKIGAGQPTLVQGQELTLTAANGTAATPNTWEGKFYDLPAVTSDGTKIEYSVKEKRPANPEDDPIRYYVTKIEGSVPLTGAIPGYTLTNTYTPPTIPVEATKIWVDGQTVRTPVQMTLYRRLAPEPIAALSALAFRRIPANQLTDEVVPESELKTIQGQTCLNKNPATFTPDTSATEANATQTLKQKWCVAQYSNDGLEYIYTVKETSTPGPGWTVEYDENDPLKVTNKYTPPIGSVTGTTVWVNGPVDDSGNKPEAYMQLYQTVGNTTTPIADTKTDVSTAAAIGTPETDAGGNQVWTVTKTWDNLPTADKMGRPITYSIKETDTNLTEITPPSYDKTQPDPLKIVNTYRAPYVEIKATKNWAGGSTLQRPAFNVGIYIKAGNELVRPENYTGASQLPTPIFSTKPGGTVTYETAGVVSVPQSTGTGVMTQDFYWYVPKTFKDGSPVTYYFEEMLDDGAVAAPLTSTAAPNEYKKTYQYDEAAATGTGETRTMAILNTYVPPMLKDNEKVVGTKEWSGGAEADRKDVTLEVWRKTENGTPEKVDDAAHSYDKLLAANAAASHNWTAEWDNVLPKTEQATGLPYFYWVDETTVPDGWTRTNPMNQTMPTAEADRKIVRNVYVKPQGPVEAKKTWVGGTSLTPPAVTFTLYRIAEGMVDREAVPAAEIVQGQAGFETTNPVTKNPTDFSEITVKWTTNLKNQDGKPYVFSIGEAPIANFVPTVAQANPLQITNTYESPKIPVTPEVKWLGGTVADRETVTVTLYRKDPVTGTVTVAGTQELKADEAAVHNWKHTFTDLDEREQTTGQLYVYYADESATTDRWIKVKSEADQTPITNNDTLIITNKYVPKVGEVSGKKVWVNGANADKTPIELRLYRKKPNTQFAIVGDPKTVTSDAPTATWQDMPETDTDGLPFTYIVDETLNVYDVAQGKWVKVESDGITETTAMNDSLTVRNKFVTKTTPVTGDLTFVNGPTAKPAVTMHLYRVNSDGTRTEVGTAKDFPAGNTPTLSNTWADMPQYDDTGTAITYVVDVVTEPDNYYRVEGPSGTEHTASNNDLSIHLRYRTPRTEVKVTKNWVNGSALLRPSVTLRLLQNGSLYQGTGAPQTIAATTTAGVMSDTSKSWPDLPLTDDSGTPYVYTVEEELAAGEPYTVAYDNTADPRVVTNTYVPPTLPSVVGEVEWHGGPDAKEGVTVTLKRKIEGGTPTGIGTGEDHTFPPADYWTDNHEWTNLPATDLDGNPYIYSLEHKGAAPTDYTVKQDPNNPLKVHYYYKQPMIELTGTKVWDGGPATHPSVQLVLKRKLGAGAEEPVPVSDLSTDSGFVAQNPVQIADGTTTVAWKTFEKTANGEAYTFSIGEVTVPDGYEMSANNTALTVTNKYVPKDIEIKAVKVWDGGSNANGGVRPNVTFTISRTLNGTPDVVTGFVNEAGYATTADVTLTNAATGAEVKWKVPSTDQATGTPYVYSVSEAPVAGYSTTVTSDGNSWTATNRYEIPKAKLTINVHWDGGPSPYPATSVDIKANGTTVQNVPFSSNGTSTYTEADIELPLTDREGNLITYTIAQPGAPAKYTETIEEPAGTQLDPNVTKTLNIKNKFVPGRGDVNGYKTWVGGETVREDIWFKLYREDAGGTLVEVSAEDGGGIKKLTPTDVETIWTNVKIEDENGVPYVFGVKEVNEDGTNEAWTPTDFVKTENGTTVTNTYVPPIIAELEGKKIWSPTATTHPDIWFELMRKVGENGTAEVVTDGNGVSRQQLVYPVVSVFWHDLPGRTDRGELYTYFVREVDDTGADYTPDGFDKSEDGMEVTNARLSNLTVKLITNPDSEQLFKLTVMSDNDIRPDAYLNSDGEEVNTPSTSFYEKVKSTLYRIQLPDINHDEWAVESIECKSRPLDSTGDYDTEVEINAQLSLHGRLTGLFSIPKVPVERDIYCTYTLRNLSVGKIVVKNVTYPNANVNGGILPTYHYGTTGTGFNSFDLSTSDTPNSTDVTPGNYSVAQQNLDGWVTIDIIATSSYPGRNPLKNKKEDPTGAYSFLNGGAIPAGYTGTGFDSIAEFDVKGGEVVTLTYVNVPPNTVLLKKLTIPAGAGERFPIVGLFEGTIGHGQVLVRTDIQPGTGERHVVKELPLEGWTKHSVGCVEVGPVNNVKSYGDLYTMEAWYGLDPGEVVMCTFVNRAYGVDEENPEINDPDIPGITDKGVAGGGFYANGLPRTGFSPNRVTALPEQAVSKLYQASELTLTIPKLDLSMQIAGVPAVDGEWDVSWLGTQAGYLEGTAYPTHEGNSVITAHVWDAYNNPGPFAELKTLAYGDRFEISAYGKTYVYEVRDSKQVLETDVEKVTAAKDGTWVTLLTCEDYSEATNDYGHRRVVEAILVEVK